MIRVLPGRQAPSPGFSGGVPGDSTCLEHLFEKHGDYILTRTVIDCIGNSRIFRFLSVCFF